MYYMRVILSKNQPTWNLNMARKIVSISLPETEYRELQQRAELTGTNISSMFRDGYRSSLEVDRILRILSTDMDMKFEELKTFISNEIRSISGGKNG